MAILYLDILTRIVLFNFCCLFSWKTCKEKQWRCRLHLLKCISLTVCGQRMFLNSEKIERILRQCTLMLTGSLLKYVNFTLFSVCPCSVNRFFVKAGSPSFIILVKGSPFCTQFLIGKKIHGLWKTPAIKSLTFYTILFHLRGVYYKEWLMVVKSKAIHKCGSLLAWWDHPSNLCNIRPGPEEVMFTV